MSSRKKRKTGNDLVVAVSNSYNNSNVICLCSSSGEDNEEQEDQLFKSDAALALALHQQLNNEANAHYKSDEAFAKSLQQLPLSPPTTSSYQQQYASDAALAAQLSASSTTISSSLTIKDALINSQIPENPPIRTSGILPLLVSYYSKKKNNTDKTATVYLSKHTSDQL
jgi:hypothetical protein